LFQSFGGIPTHGFQDFFLGKRTFYMVWRIVWNSTIGTWAEWFTENSCTP